MKNFILLFSFLFITAVAWGQSNEVNPRPIDSTEPEYDGKILNQMERVDGEGDENIRQEMEERPDVENIDESLPGYVAPEEGYEEDVSW